MSNVVKAFAASFKTEKQANGAVEHSIIFLVPTSKKLRGKITKE